MLLKLDGNKGLSEYVGLCLWMWKCIYSCLDIVRHLLLFADDNTVVAFSEIMKFFAMKCQYGNACIKIYTELQNNK
jgi:hypothetical protein